MDQVMLWVGPILAIVGIVMLAIAQYRVGAARAWQELATVRGIEKADLEKRFTDMEDRFKELENKYDHVIELLESNIARHVGDRVIKEIIATLVSNERVKQEE